MREFTYSETFQVKGRGTCYVIGRDQMPEDLYDPNQMRGETVLLNGEPYRVLAAETFAIGRSPESPYRLSFSLLAEPTDVRVEQEK